MRERPGPLADAWIALVDIAMDAVGHAGIADMPVGQPEALRQLRRRERAPGREKRLPMRAHLAVSVDELIEDAGQRAIAGKQRGAPLGPAASRSGATLHRHASL